MRISLAQELQIYPETGGSTWKIEENKLLLFLILVIEFSTAHFFAICGSYAAIFGNFLGVKKEN